MKKLLILISIVCLTGILTGCDDQISSRTFAGPACLRYRIVQIDGKLYLASASYQNYYVVGPEVKTENPEVRFVPEKP